MNIDDHVAIGIKRPAEEEGCCEPVFILAKQQRVSCPYDDCTYTASKRTGISRHVKEVHLKLKGYVCTQCGLGFSRSQSLHEHVAHVHLKIKKYPCTLCPLSFARSQTLKEHISQVHLKTKNFPCSYCSLSFARSQSLKKHIQEVHLKDKIFHCEYCDKTFTRPGALKDHLNGVHLDKKQFQCDKCSMTFVRLAKLKRHQNTVHATSRPFKCTFCTMDFADASNLTRHVKFIHQGLRPVSCTVPECTMKFTTKSAQKHHFQSWHTKEGQQRKIRRQDRVHQLLNSHYAVDAECTIRFANGCVPDPDKFSARIDFHVIGITNATVIVECDEQGHRDYTLKCELTRMEQIHDSIIKAGTIDLHERPLVFIRYNPDSCTINEQTITTTRQNKEERLINVLKSIQNGSLALKPLLNLIYINYDLIDGQPTVCQDPDFDEQSKASIVLVC